MTRATRRVHKSPVGANLRRFRKSRNFTLNGLMRASGVHRITIAEIESGSRHNPRLVTLEALARVLEVPVVSFFGEAAQ